VEEFGEDGLTRLNFQGSPNVDAFLEEEGAMPLPPYIKRGRNDNRTKLDRERYQTIFSRKKGAAAAPTAGLHFSESLVERLAKRQIDLAEITLHVGHGTFRPVRSKDIRDHKLGRELYRISQRAADAVNGAKKSGRRIIAVGTTVVRTLETAAADGEVMAGKGYTELLITPGFRFHMIDGLITNFHLPKSSLLFLVAAFAGLDLIRGVYRWAIDKRYRFYSYGDAMLIL
jgi:S-adenosylmethionine:tRNA ribosyltransferase-isomerase